MINAFKRLINAVVPVLFIAAGIFLVVMGVRNVRYQKEYTPAAAVVSYINIVDDARGPVHYDTYVKYSAGGKEYESLLPGSRGGWKAGDELQVLYDPADPSRVVYLGSQSPVLFFIAGAVAILLGAVAIIRLFKYK